MLASAPIDYVKWDWNRFLTEPWTPAVPPERQGEMFHRYVLGLYDLYSRLTTRFPAILFESCASGGARFDAGLLAWAPQAWTSDDTDAVERLAIQWGSSIPYPLSSMGAHVSAVPNHQTGRVTPIGFRAAVAMFGAFGYELDPTALTDDEKAEVRRQVAFYVERRDLFQRGRFLRLRSPFEGNGNETAWMVASETGDRAVVGFYRVLSRPQPRRNRLALRGLDPAATYEVTVWTSFDGPDGSFVRGGDELMHLGLRLEPPDPPPAGPDFPDGIRIVRGDFQFRLFDLRRASATCAADSPGCRSREHDSRVHAGALTAGVEQARSRTWRVGEAEAGRQRVPDSRSSGGLRRRARTARGRWAMNVSRVSASPTVVVRS